MAVLGKEDFFSKLKTLIGDNDDDNSLSLIEDFTDTYESLTNNTNNNENWEQKFKDMETKFNENDKAWRKKYKDRFFSNSNDNYGTNTNNGDTGEEIDPDDIKIDDLFKEV